MKGEVVKVMKILDCVFWICCVALLYHFLLFAWQLNRPSVIHYPVILAKAGIQ